MQYTSWEIQNEIIRSCHEIILSKIINKVNNIKCFFSNSKQNAQMYPGIEQFSLYVRYFYLKYKIIKEQSGIC